MKLPESRGRRLALCLSLIPAAPSATAALTVCALDGLLRIAPYGLPDAVFFAPVLIGAIAGAAGSAAAAFSLPIRYWTRIALALTCLFAVFITFPAFWFLADTALYAAFGIGMDRAFAD
jgi:hypothetical protein